MKIITGTPETKTEHSTGAAAAGFLLSMGIPAMIAIIGIANLGWDAIHWLGAIIWGVVATVALTLFSMMGKKMGMTRMDLLDLLGSIFAQPGTSSSRATGAFIHHMNGALLVVAWAYGTALIGWQANWVTALIWGVVLWALALLMMSTIGAVHPAIRREARKTRVLLLQTLAKRHRWVAFWGIWYTALFSDYCIRPGRWDNTLELAKKVIQRKREINLLYISRG